MRLFALALLLVTAVDLPAQKSGPATVSPTIGDRPSAGVAHNDFAKAAFLAHGGEKLKAMKTLILRGSVDLNVFNQSMPGVFSTSISGEKYYFEIVSAMQTLKQVHNGKRTSSSIDGFSLPPITSLGFPLLLRFGDPGYAVSSLEGKKKGRGFRITTPEGFYTDFIIDEKTGRVKGYDSSYDVGGRIVTTSVEIKTYEVVNGVTVPKDYAQRFDLGTLTAYASFKTKTIQVNTPIDDATFAIE